ncbi:MAG: ATP-binding protein [Christensenellales bacterium]|jgi:DNA polymerase-3 subunit delta'
MEEHIKNLRQKHVHAYLIKGAAGSGKMCMACQIAAQILDVPAQSASKHPDFIHITPGKAAISVDQVRELQHLLAQKPFRAAVRVCVVDQAHRMTAQAQNALLKTLEEPQGAVILLLSETSMLPTVESRCFHLQPRKMQAHEIEALLIEQGYDETKSKICAVLSCGLYGAAQRWAQDERLFQLRRDTIEGARRLFAPRADRQAYVAFFKENKDDYILILDVLITFFRDMMVVKLDQEGSGMINIDFEQAVINGSGYFTYGQLQKMIDRIILCKKQMASFANYLLAVEDMLVDIMEVKRI